MSPRRLETFTDGVIAVVITIMVLTLRPPTGSSLHDLRPLVPKLSVYLLSFVFVAIYWNNHHNLMHVVDRVNGAAHWANAHFAAPFGQAQAERAGAGRSRPRSPERELR